MNEMDKIENFEYEYMGFGVHKSSCIIRIEKNGDMFYILFEDIGNGTSVTNASEQLASDIVNLYSINPTKCRFFETYRIYNYDSIDEITYEWDYNNKFIARKPTWKNANLSLLKFFNIN
ncbi:MAG TPA: hypothetical protein PLN85_00510 [archaeon]|nr:hypothetical protein [archaeon]